MGLTQEQFDNLDGDLRIALANNGLPDLESVNDATDEHLLSLGLTEDQVFILRGFDPEELGLTGDTLDINLPDAVSNLLGGQEDSSPPEEAPKKKPRKGGAEPVEVRIVLDQTDRVVVQFSEGEDVHRVVIPRSEIVEDLGENRVLVDPKDLRKGEPYGLPWEEIIEVRITSVEVARQLRRNGIWTGADMMNLPKPAQAALMAALALDVQAMRTATWLYLQNHGEV